MKNNRTTLTGKSRERRERHIREICTVHRPRRENMYCTPPQTWKYVLYTAPNVKICTVHRSRRIRELLKKFTQYAADATWFVWKFSRLIRSHQPLLEILGIFFIYYIKGLKINLTFIYLLPCLWYNYLNSPLSYKKKIIAQRCQGFLPCCRFAHLGWTCGGGGICGPIFLFLCFHPFLHWWLEGGGMYHIS